jgi:hypothetical protein
MGWGVIAFDIILRVSSILSELMQFGLIDLSGSGLVVSM